MPSWNFTKPGQLKAYEVRKMTPIDFEGNRSKVKVTQTKQNKILELKFGFQGITIECFHGMSLNLGS